MRLDALARSKTAISVDRLEERDLDYATSGRALSSLRGRLKLAIANFQGCAGEYVNFVKKVPGACRCCRCCGGDWGPQEYAWSDF